MAHRLLVLTNQGRDEEYLIIVLIVECENHCFLFVQPQYVVINADQDEPHHANVYVLLFLDAKVDEYQVVEKSYGCLNGDDCEQNWLLLHVHDPRLLLHYVELFLHANEAIDHAFDDFVEEDDEILDFLIQAKMYSSVLYEIVLDQQQNVSLMLWRTQQ